MKTAASATVIGSDHGNPAVRRKRQTIALSLLVLCGLLVWNFNPAARIDRYLSDLAMSRIYHPISLGIQVVHITPEDLEAHGGLPFDSDVLAKALRAIDAAGAARLLVDLPLLTSVDPTGKAAMARALADFGRDRIGVSSAMSLSIPDFAALDEHVTLVDAQLRPDTDLSFRAVRTAGANPARWLANGDLTSTPADIDLRLDPDSVSVIAVSELLPPDADVSYLSGARVILSLDPSISPSGIVMPRHGEIARSSLLAFAVHSLENGHPERVWAGRVVACLLAMVSLTAGFLAFSLLRRPILVFGAALAVAIVNLAVSGIVNTKLGTVAWPFLNLSLFATASCLVLVARLQLLELTAMLVRGNVSPEEAWAWRTHGQRPLPAVLFDANGRIKRMNALAAALLGSGQPNLAQEVMPRIGERSSQFRLLPAADADEIVFELEWPSEALPLVLLRDITESVSREERLKKKLLTDPLTGLCNRLGFEQALNIVAAKKDGAYGVFYMDMNGFKAVNDTHGHDAGDALLRVVSDRMRSVTRGKDTLARLGGDEFGLVVHQALSRDDMQSVADKIEAAVSEPVTIGALTVRVGIAVGFSAPFYRKEQAEAVLKRADTAMHERKSALKQRQARLKRLGAVA